jgi:hypothetical protein
MDVLLDLAKLLVGALLGYLLSQRGADRQFRRQQVRQRVDEARKIYVEARTQALHVTGALRRDAPGDGLSDERRARVGERLGRLFEARIALDVHGATAVAIALERVALDARELSNWTLLSLSGMSQADQTDERDFAAYYEAWERMRAHLDDSQAAWAQWQADQEAVADRWGWPRRVRGWRVWARLRRSPARRGTVAADNQADGA